LLQTRRREVEGYLTAIGQHWREDSSNLDLHHTRNRVRQSLVPLLERDFNPEITERLADFAEIARAEEIYWDEELYRRMGAKPWQKEVLLQLPLALRRRLVRATAPPGLQLEFGQVESILEIAAGEGNSRRVCNLPGGWRFERRAASLAFVPPAAKGGTPEVLHGGGFATLRISSRENPAGGPSRRI
jgi:tRNA(Ile)-lysidine synthase